MVTTTRDLPVPQRAGEAPARQGTQRTRRRGDGQRRTVNQMPPGGGRYLEYRPPRGPFQPSDRVRTVRITQDFNSQGLSHPRQWPGSARESWGGGVAPHRRPDGMAAELSLGGECRPIDDAAGLTASLALVKASTWALARRWPAGRLRADRRRCTRKPPPRLPRAAT